VTICVSGRHSQHHDSALTAGKTPAGIGPLGLSMTIGVGDFARHSLLIAANAAQVLQELGMGY
jgi:hypothetical protein